LIVDLTGGVVQERANQVITRAKEVLKAKKQSQSHHHNCIFRGFCSIIMVQWKAELVEEIPNSGRHGDINNVILDEDNNEASLTFEDMLSDDIGGHDSFFDALNEPSEDYFTPAIP
jgi:hypothetical protein